MSLDLQVNGKRLDNDCPTRQLIVVGNGLDLYCGLASRFDDFFGPRRKIMEPVEYSALHGVTGWEKCLINNGLTAWDIVLAICAFKDADSKNWSDIEAAIADWVVPQVYVEDKVCIVENKHLKKVLSHLNTTRFGYVPENRFSEGEVAWFLEHKYGENHWDHAKLLDKLLDELHELEAEFARYMLSTVESAAGYSEKHRLVSHGMVFDEVEGRPVHSLETSILNFNYTIPDELFRRERFGLIDHYVNVHGDLRNEVVIGIDATGHMDDSSVAQFTKTYRVMGIGSSAVRGLVYPGRGTGSGSATALMKFPSLAFSTTDL